MTLKTTKPPGPEHVGAADFERAVEEKGENDARLTNISKRLPPKLAEYRHPKSSEEVWQSVDLLHLFAQVGPNARKILLDIAGRLARGAKQYGDFDGENAKRNWDQETYEEHLDAVVYQAAKRLGGS